MDTLIAYWSRTGHSRKIAQHIGRALGLPVHDLRDGLPTARQLVLVSAIYANRTDPALLEALSGLGPAHTDRVLLVLTCTSPDGRDDGLRDALTRQGLNVDPRRHVCPGSFLLVRFRRPNRQDLEQAAQFVREALKEAL